MGQIFLNKTYMLARKPPISLRAVRHAPCDLCLGAGIQHQDELVAIMGMLLPRVCGMHGIANINKFIVDTNEAISSTQNALLGIIRNKRFIF